MKKNFTAVLAAFMAFLMLVLCGCGKKSQKTEFYVTVEAQSGVVLTVSSDYKVTNVEAVSQTVADAISELDLKEKDFSAAAALLCQKLSDIGFIADGKNVLFTVEAPHTNAYNTLLEQFRTALNKTAVLHTMFIGERNEEIAKLAESVNQTYAKAFFCHNMAKNVDGMSEQALITMSIDEIIAELNKQSANIDEIINESNKEQENKAEQNAPISGGGSNSGTASSTPSQSGTSSDNPSSDVPTSSNPSSGSEPTASTPESSTPESSTPESGEKDYPVSSGSNEYVPGWY